MDHRCLYGHRVPAAFTFAIQNRACPTCGAPTVTINGYQAARKLATDAGLDAVVAFQAVRVLENDWVLTPAAPAAAPSATPGPALAAAEAPAAAPPPAEEEVVVVEDVADPATAPSPSAAPEAAAEPAAVAAPEPRITARVKSEKPRPEPRVEPAVGGAPPVVAASNGPGFGQEEEDFFKGA